MSAGELSLTVRSEVFPIAGRFVISRGARTEARVVIVEARARGATGRGEAVPYPRYGESVEGVLAAVAAWVPTRDRDRLRRQMPAGAARNAIDCALIDLECKLTGRSAAEVFAVPPFRPAVTCYTLSLDAPAAMAERASGVPHLPLLKLKLGGAGDNERMAAVRQARPDARIVVDANEAWREADLEPLFEAAAKAGVELVEQPLPAGRDEALAHMRRPVPVCADEAVHTTADLAPLIGRYDAVNIKLDKAGGLTEALAMAAEARRLGLRVMVGCMLATSLSMAPALLVAAGADWIDLDGPLLLAADRPHGLPYRNGIVEPARPELWG
jgi:L-alanine-DL-glutamate epimerase-like enolase superfamily enzyme